jgi:hypothetical protein
MVLTLRKRLCFSTTHISTFSEASSPPTGGGVIAGPAVVVGATQGNPIALVTDPGHCVSIRDETNLKLTVFYLRHQARISRIVAHASVALTAVSSLGSTKE